MAKRGGPLPLTAPHHGVCDVTHTPHTHTQHRAAGRDVPPYFTHTHTHKYTHPPGRGGGGGGGGGGGEGCAAPI